MVPLPLHSQWVVAEIVVRRQGLTGLYRQCRLSISGIGANGTYGSDRFTIFADDRPLVDPCHRLQVWYAAQCAYIFLQNSPPLSFRCIDKCPLMNGVGFVVDGFFEEYLSFVWSEDVL